MKKTILTLGLLTIIGCQPKVAEPAPYNDALTQFIVCDIAQLDGMKTLTSYEVEVVDVNGLVRSSNDNGKNLRFRFCDTLGKYKLGQPIHFDKNK
jgi:hypothetical protein